MGWLWSSQLSASETRPQQETKPSELLPSIKPDTTPTQPPPPSAQSQSKSEQADAELNAFLSSLEQDATAKPSKYTTPRAPLDPSKPDITPYALRPRQMSCRAAFDSAFYCNSLGGKFNDIYRYGSLQSCSEHWEAFWFCMRNKGLSEPEKGERIAEYYEGREERELARRAGGKSSEDVWEMRTAPVEKAFWRVP